MACASRRLAYACGALAGMIVAGAAAQDQPIYRYVDPNGRIIYSDHVPPPDAKSVEAKKLSPNLHRDRPGCTRHAARAGPVSGDALHVLRAATSATAPRRSSTGAACRITTVDVQEPSGAEKLKKLTGELQAPVLQAGDKLMVKGFSEVQWQMLLDNAGYPPAPPTRRTAPAAAPPKAAAAPAPAVPAAPAPGGYPQN